MGRAPCCDKANVKKGPWSLEEDAILKAYIEKHGTGGNWIALPQKIGLKRCGKSCRLRWLNYLRPNIKHGGFTDEEDNIICSLYINIGSRWSIIASQLPGRTDNDIKNYWNTKLKKKLLGKQRKEHSKRANLVKQEVKRQAHQDYMFPGVVNHVPYWAEMPASVPIMRNPNQEFSHHQPIITTTENLQYSMDAFPTQDQLLYANSLNMISSSSSTTASINPMFGTCVSQLSADVFQGHESVPFELTEETVYGNLDQLDGFSYGLEVMGGSTGTSSVASAESSSWGADMNSLVYDYPSMVPTFEDNKEGVVPQDSTYQEELRYFGHNNIIL